MPLRKFLILRKPPSGCLEERTALIQPIVHSFTAAFVGAADPGLQGRRKRANVAPGNLVTLREGVS